MAYCPSTASFGFLSTRTDTLPEVVEATTVLVPTGLQPEVPPALVRVYDTTGGSRTAVSAEPVCCAPPIGSSAGTVVEPATAAAPIGASPSARSGVVEPVAVADRRKVDAAGEVAA